MSYTPSYVLPAHANKAREANTKASFSFTNKAEIRIKIMIFAAMLTCFIAAVNI